MPFNHTTTKFDPDSPVYTRELGFAATRYDLGQSIGTPLGVGVIAGILKADFEFPQDGDSETRVNASPDSPVYVVGLGGKSAPFRAAALRESSVHSPDLPDGSPLTSPISEIAYKENLPEGWDSETLRLWWLYYGGTWTDVKDSLIEQGMSADDARSLASKRKDLLMGTKRWRRRGF